MANNKKKCKDCEYCECSGRMNAKYSSTYKSRKTYYCRHQNVHDYTRNTFVGFGDTTLESPLQLKTAKRWCPLNQEE